MISGRYEMMIPGRYEMMISGRYETIISGRCEMMILGQYEMMISGRYEMMISGPYKKRTLGRARFFGFLLCKYLVPIWFKCRPNTFPISIIYRDYKYINQFILPIKSYDVPVSFRYKYILPILSQHDPIVLKKVIE